MVLVISPTSQAIDENLEDAIMAIPADFDNDGDQDVVASGADPNAIYWYENLDGQGTFGPAQGLY